MRYREMTESSEIQQLREEIQELRLLYRRLAETLLPEEEPTPEEKAPLDDESREYFSESEFLRMLQGDVRRSSKRSASAGIRRRARRWRMGSLITIISNVQDIEMFEWRA
jgi:uncharacterized protein involved in exopolysaccharide biosynthesis